MNNLPLLLADANHIELLGAIDDDIVIMRGRCMPDSGPSDICAIYLPREMFHEILDEILDYKAVLYDDSEQFAGAGHVVFQGVREVIDVTLREGGLGSPLRQAWGYVVSGYELDLEHG